MPAPSSTKHPEFEELKQKQCLHMSILSTIPPELGGLMQHPPQL